MDSNISPRNPFVRTAEETAPLGQGGELNVAPAVHFPDTERMEQIFQENLEYFLQFFEELEVNRNCTNHSLRMRSGRAHVKKVVQPLFKKLGEMVKKGAKKLSEMHVCRKMKEIYEFLDHCDFKLIRKSEVPLMEEHVNESLTHLLEEYTQLEAHMDTISAEDLLKKIYEILLAINSITFPPELYEVRNAMVAEVTTKYLAIQKLNEGQLIPFPTFTRDGKPVVIEYEYHHRLNLGRTDIPVFVFAPALKKNQEDFCPILMFRGTRFVFSNMTDFRSIVENINKMGPARGLYDEFKVTLHAFLKSWFSGNRQHNPRFRIFGYSQGAVLAQRSIVDFHMFLEKGELNASYSFNAPAVEEDMVKRWNEMKTTEKPVSKVYVVSKDPVSFRGFFFIGDVREVMPTTYHGMLAAHYGAKLLESVWDMFEVSMEEEHSATRKLVNCVMSSNLMEKIYHGFVTGITLWQKPHGTIQEHNARNMQQ